ncbi:MAG: hypothetical protein J5486_08175 [Bacteroidaceae bacterium]|nr:hypothetical protein [Bacteroidaceae bacterium]
MSANKGDEAYRVYDFGRKDANGQPRELHIEQARDAIDYRPHFLVHRVVVMCLWG